MFGGRENVGNVSPENKIYEIFFVFCTLPLLN